MLQTYENANKEKNYEKSNITIITKEIANKEKKGHNITINKKVGKY